MVVSAQGSDSTNSRLSGTHLIASMVAWFVVTAIVVILMVGYTRSAFITLPQQIDGFRSTALYRTTANPVMLDVLFVLSLPLLRQIIVGILYFAMGAFIFWRALGHRVAMITSIALTTVSAVPTAATFVLVPLGDPSPAILWLSILCLVIGSSTTDLLVFIYPDGRFVPRWSRWVALLIPLVSGVYTVLLVMDRSTANRSAAIGMITFVSFTFFTLGFQIYRYRHAQPIHRQQIKWLIMGVAAIMISQAIGIVFYNVLGSEPTSISALLQIILRHLILLVGYIVLLACATASAVRYRLWDVDFVINRSLVYSVVIVVLLVVMGITFAIIQALLRTVLPDGSAFVAGAVSAALAVGLFNPIRSWLRRWVDQHIYGINVDYHRLAQQARGKGAISLDEPMRSFGGYTGLKLIGRGGMGEIYAAHDPGTNRGVAIKMLPSHQDVSPDMKKRFLREARTISQLQHPNIVAVYDYGDHEGTPYLVMEYVTGNTLSSLLQSRGRFSEQACMRILSEIASALDYAHQCGVIHRDIKASNVMLETSDERVVLMDFGLAKMGASSLLTQSGEMVGTLHYIAPEQIQNASEVDHRADVYALGVLAYELFTGELPFSHNNAGAVVMAHLVQPPPDLRSIAPEVSKSTAQAVQRAMAKKPADRFASAGEFITAMQSVEAQVQAA